jgi:ABC-type Co2+ transport system permease subunit
MLNLNLDLNEVVRRAVKYLVEGLAVAVAAFYIPKKQMNLQEIAMIAVTAAASFAVLDMLAPSVGANARHGAGFGIGASLVGAPSMPGVPPM